MVCGQGSVATAKHIARVPSNIRKWSHHISTVWECSHCGSLCSLERIDLEPFYRNYLFHERREDFVARLMSTAYVRRMMRKGLKRDHSILDFGCGSGSLLASFKRLGFESCAGFDPYSTRFSDQSVLGRRYDWVVAQDVIEHVEDPFELLQELTQYVVPGGRICIGTPRAEGLDLNDVGRSIHSLHQPWHLFILSERGLRDLAARCRLTVESVDYRSVTDLWVPFVNWRFITSYVFRLDNRIDSAFERIHVGRIISSPRLWLDGLFGAIFPLKTDMIVILRKEG